MGDRTSPRMTPRRWIEYTAAILGGNAIYFLILYPVLPIRLQHLPPRPGGATPFRFDLGLLIDFICCVAVYGVIRLASSHARRLNESNRRKMG